MPTGQPTPAQILAHCGAHEYCLGIYERFSWDGVICGLPSEKKKEDEDLFLFLRRIQGIFEFEKRRTLLFTLSPAVWCEQMGRGSDEMFQRELLDLRTWKSSSKEDRFYGFRGTFRGTPLIVVPNGQNWAFAIDPSPDLKNEWTKENTIYLDLERK